MRARSLRAAVVAGLAGALAGVATFAACDRSDARTPERDVRTAAADLRAALAALPPALAEPLAIAPYLSDRWIARTPGAECTVPDSGGAGVRRRVRERLPDSSALVVYVRGPEPPAERDDDAAWHLFERPPVDTGAVQRVEIVRRARDGVQIGFVWDAPRGRASVVRWPAAGGYRAEESLHPRNSALTPALVAAGRRVLTLRCPASGPPLPDSTRRR